MSVKQKSLSGELGIEVALEAINALSLRGITPSPENYAVWVCYLTATNQDLKAELDMMILSKRMIDDNVCDQLYVKYFEDIAIGSRMMKAGGKFAAEMEDVRRGLQTAGIKTKAYGEQLEIAKKELSKNSDPIMARELVDSLVGATGEMANQSRALEDRLIESSKEIETLRVQLEQVRIEAATDSLTGLANRKEFDSVVQKLSEQSDKTGEPLSIIVCDIDFFKRINDNFGHQTGDQVIKFVATVMDRAKPKDGLVARIGGEEFAMLAPKTDKRAASSIAEKIRATVEGKRLVRRSSNEDLGKITVSLGISLRKKSETTETMIERADAALYNSKNSGRNRVSTEDTPRSKAA